MPRTSALISVGVLLLAGAALTAQSRSSSESLVPAQQTVTFNKDIAPLIWQNCTTCHRAGEYAPFSLLTYEDVRPRAREIARAIQTRHMPPWKPEPGYGEFIGNRRLSDQQIALIQRWVNEGSLQGDAKDLPTAPTWAEGWYMGQPDLIVTMPEPFEVPRNEIDVFRTFVVPIPVSARKYVRALEFHPGNAKVVHHANIKIDPTRLSRELDEAEPGVGSGGSGSRRAVFPDGYFLGWTPGQRPRIEPGPGMSWHLDPGSDMVIEMHMRPIETKEFVQASVGLFFTDKPPTQSPYMLRIGRQDIDIAPGRTDYVNSDSYTLPVDVDVLGVQPHAHYLGKDAHGWATLPDGSVKELINIKNWDFHWQDVYQFAKPVSLPKGSVLHMRYGYDNSLANQHIPGTPPQRVVFGQLYGTEMGTLWIQVLPHSEADRRKLEADFTPKLVADDIDGDLKELEIDPDNPRIHAELADCYVDAGRVDDAIRELIEAERLNPIAFRAYDLGRLFIVGRRFPEAAAAFTRAVERQPEFPESLYGIGLALDAQGRTVEAVDAYRRALALNIDLPDAHYNLARILAARGQSEEAIVHYQHAVRLRPDDAEAAAALARLRNSSQARK